MSTKGKSPSGRQPITEERKRLFLDELRRNGGLFAAAARVASPHLSSDTRGTSSGYSGFKNLQNRDPHFAAQVDAILEEVAEEVAAEIKRRGQDGVDKPIFQGGKRAKDHDGSPASIREYSDRLLLARARALMPEDYGEKVRHTHEHQHTLKNRWFIDADVIELLPPHLMEHLTEIVNFLDARQKELAGSYLPGEVEDAEFELIEDHSEQAEHLDIDLGEAELAKAMEAG